MLLVNYDCAMNEHFYTFLYAIRVLYMEFKLNTIAMHLASNIICVEFKKKGKKKGQCNSLYAKSESPRIFIIQPHKGHIVQFYIPKLSFVPVCFDQLQHASLLVVQALLLQLDEVYKKNGSSMIISPNYS